MRSDAEVAGVVVVRVRLESSYDVPFGGGGTELAISSAFANSSGRKVLRWLTGTSAKSLGRRASRAL